MAESEVAAVADDEAFVKHVPENPLPEEILNMSKKDTVCEFCGVSYLVYREIKSLEDQLAETKNELERYRTYKSQLKDVEQKHSNLTKRCELHEESLTKKEGIISMMQVRLLDYEKTLQSNKSKILSLESEIHKHSSHQASLQQAIQKFSANVGALKSQCLIIKSDAKSQKSRMADELAKLNNELLTVQTRCNEKILRVQSQHETTSTTLHEKCKEYDDLRIQLIEMTNSQKQIKNHNADIELDSLKIQQTALKNELKIAKETIATSETLANNLRQELDSAQLEIVNLHNDYSSRIESAEHRNEALSDELVNTRRAADDYRIEIEPEIERLKRLVEQLSANQQPDITAQQQAHESTVELLRSQIKQLNEEIAHRLSEKEVLVQSHKEQLERIRSEHDARLQRRLSEAASAHDAVLVQRSRDARSLQDVETRLRREHAVELKLERERHKAIIAANEQRWRERLDEKISSREEVKLLKQQLDERTAIYEDTDKRQKREIDSLNRLVEQLQQKMYDDATNADVATQRKSDGSEVEIEQLKQRMFKLKDTLSSTHEAKMSVEKELDLERLHTRQLRETVERECDERLALTEALSRAREQLIRLNVPVDQLNYLCHRGQHHIPQSNSSPGRSNNNNINSHRDMNANDAIDKNRTFVKSFSANTTSNSIAINDGQRSTRRADSSTSEASVVARPIVASSKSRTSELNKTGQLSPIGRQAERRQNVSDIRRKMAVLMSRHG